MTGAYDWIARTGDVWADEWRRTDRSFAGLTGHLCQAVLAAAPAFTRGLDMGCGAGETTLAIAAARPSASVLGVDLSAGLIEVSRARSSMGRVGGGRVNAGPGGGGSGGRIAADGLDPLAMIDGDAAEAAAEGRFEAIGSDGAAFLIGDVVEMAGRHGPFDLMFSRHGVMFFADPVGAFRELRRAAAPGAALVFSCFRERERNAFAGDLAAAVLGESPREVAGYAPGPFAFASEEGVGAILKEAGWSVSSAEAVDFAYVAGMGDDAVDDAVSFFSRIGPVAAAIAAADGDGRAALILRLRDALARWYDGERVALPASAWIWTARAEGEIA